MDPAFLAAIPALAALTSLAYSRGRKRGHRDNQQAQLARVDTDGTRRDAALLTVLGFDPAAHRILPVLKPYKGLRIIDRAGAPCGFFTEKQLTSPKVRRQWREEMRRTEVTAA